MFSVCTLIRNVVIEGCVFVRVDQETPVWRREKKKHIPHTNNDVSHFLLFFLFYLLSQWNKDKMRPCCHRIRFQSKHSEPCESQGRHAESQRPDRKGIEVVTLTYAAYTIKTQTGVHTITFLITQMLSWLVFYFISMQSETSVKWQIKLNNVTLK